MRARCDCHARRDHLRGQRVDEGSHVFDSSLCAADHLDSDLAELADQTVQDKLQDELQSVVGDGPLEPEHLPRLEYVAAVIKESLRLRPIIPIVARRLTEDFENEDRVPAGVSKCPNIG